MLLPVSFERPGTTLLDPQVKFGQFLYGAQIVRARDEEVGGEEFGDPIQPNNADNWAPPTVAAKKTGS